VLLHGNICVRVCWPCSCSVASLDTATALGCEVGATSCVKALQQLGYSCGQSVMAADLAAFVTHKQLLGGVVAVEAALQHCRQSSPGLLGETRPPVVGLESLLQVATFTAEQYSQYSAAVRSDTHVTTTNVCWTNLSSHDRCMTGCTESFMTACS
jgi:hypothetical protein